MSNLSGFDSAAVGFDSVPAENKPCTAISTQTSEFEERGASSQTNTTKDVGCTASEDIQPLSQYITGLNEFLRKVVPGVLEQLSQNDREMAYSSDSEEEEVSRAVILHEMKVGDRSGCGDHQSSVLAVSWSCSGTLAVSVGSDQHENWCQGPGLVQIYSFKRSDGVQSIDIEERECVSVLRYHPTISVFLAYGTASGKLVVRQGSEGSLNAPVGSARVTALRWADLSLANIYLTMLVRSTGQRRCGSDQVLLSAGSDGAVTVWRVNVPAGTFEKIVRYELDSGSKPDITCFDIPRSHPLRSFGDTTPDVIVVGTKSGKLYHFEVGDQVGDEHPVCVNLKGLRTCVLNVEFSQQKIELFASLSIDSELRLYRVGQTSPLKIFCLDVAASCMTWLGSSPYVLLGSVGSDKEALRVYNASNGKLVPVDGLKGSGKVTCVDVHQSGCYKIAAGDSGNTVRVWELPTLRDNYAWDVFDV